MLSALMAMEMRSSSRHPGALGASSCRSRSRSAQQAQLLACARQQLPRRRGPQRPAAHDQHRAHLGLERTQPLRDRRLRDIQALGGALESLPPRWRQGIPGQQGS